MTRPLSFIPPCLPKLAKLPPAGDGWLHEPKLDGWRIQLVKERHRVALFSRNGHDLAGRVPRLLSALQAMPVRSCIIDGELVGEDRTRPGSIWTLHRALGDGRDDDVTIAGFDLLALEGRDLRPATLVERKAELRLVIARAALPGLVAIDHFPDGSALMEAARELGFEGVVSKRVSAPYRSGRRPEWVKTKCPVWLEANRERWRAFAK